MYKEFKPVADLQPYIQCVWVMTAAAGVQTAPERLVPDGNIELLLNYGSHALKSTANTPDKIELFKGSQLIGQRSTYYFTAVSGPIDVISISFKPGGLSPFIRQPVTDITDCTVPLQYLNGFFSEMEESVFEANTLEDKVICIQQILLRELQLNRDKVEKLNDFIPAVGLLSRYQSVAAFLRDYCIHEKKLQRGFDHYVGVAPKFLQRVLRFKNAVTSLYRPGFKSLTAVAYDCGYYDQAHFTNEFKFFSGLKPKEYLQECQNGFSEIWAGE